MAPSIQSALSPAYLARILGLRLKAKAVLEGTLAGWHRSPFHGYSSEFSQYKGYGPGEDLRHLDWKVYARRDHLVVRQYRDETNASVYLVLDSSASMGFPPGQGLGKLDYAAVLAASITLLAERQRDAVSLAHGGDGLKEFLPPESGPLRTGDVLRRLEALRAEGKTDLEGLFAAMAPRIRGQSFVFLFTDLWQDPEAIAAGLRRIRHKTRVATLVRLRAPEEEKFLADGVYRLRDLEAGDEIEVEAAQARPAYLNAVKAQESKIAGECSRLGVRLFSITPVGPLAAALRMVLV
jgi:uncharacterized protein (DUF58 family)